MHKRESLCRKCGTRLSYIGPDNQVHWEYGCIDDEGLICEDCRAFTKLKTIREEKDKNNSNG